MIITYSVPESRVVAVLYILIRCEVVVTLSARLSVCVLTQRMQRYYLDAELTSMLSPDDRPDDSAAQVTLTASACSFPPTFVYSLFETPGVVASECNAWFGLLMKFFFFMV